MKLQVDLQKIIDTLPLGAHVIDRQGRIVEANRAWLIRFGITMDHVRGKLLSEVMRDMIYFDGGEPRKDSPWEYTHPAALDVLETKLPSSATFRQGQSVAVARPLLDDQGEILYVVTTIVEKVCAAELEPLPEMTGKRLMDEALLGESRPMRFLKQLILQVAQSDATVLISGPTGTGKEVVASEIQRHSARAKQPFIKVNCAAIPENLMEAELFGYEKGAFTGASKEGKAGLLEMADGGTILLDEIGEMPLSLQPKLLRAIQERMIVRVGGLRSIPIDVRILASTNRELAKQVEEGRFRADLYYRLNVIPITVPALRERGDDIVLLGKRFLREFNEKYEKQVSLTSGAWRELRDYPWPGNVRELRNIMERLVVLNWGYEITQSQLQSLLYQNSMEKQDTEEKTTLQEATDRLQRQMILRALQEHRTTYRAAAVLGISQSTLVRRAKQLGISTSHDTR